MDEVNYKIKKFDVLIFTAKSTKYNFKNSNQFSWVRKNKRKKNIEISLKKNFRGTNYNNRVLVGSFIFKIKKS